MDAACSAPMSFGEEHFGQAPLGNLGRVHRLIKTANAMAEHPGGSLPDKMHNPAGYQGLMRLVKQPTVTHEAVLHTHRQRTLDKAGSGTDVVLFLHDGTELDYTGKKSLKDLGQIGNGSGRGYICHNSLAVSAATGEVLGLANQILHRRAHVAKNESAEAKRDRETRESLLWIQACTASGPIPEGCTWVDVCDRGADTFEFLDSAVATGRGFVTRSSPNREIQIGHGPDGKPGQLHDYALSLAKTGQRKVKVAGRHGQPAREAIVAYAGAAVSVLPPKKKRGKHRGVPLLLWVVIAAEGDPPAGVEPVLWILLTNHPAEIKKGIVAALDWYERRWIIEDYHKAQKTGGGIESPQFTKEERLQPVIALLSVIAVMLLNLRWHNRQPDAETTPARKVVPEVYVAVLSVWRLKERLPNWSVKEFFLALARLGGYLPRHRRGQPGWLVLWRGWMKLQDMVEYALAARLEKSD